VQELEKEVHLVQGFFDTPLLLWALKRTPGNLDHVFFERGIGMNRHFLQVCPGLNLRPGIEIRHILQSHICGHIGAVGCQSS
jgi:hypothetical protein